MKAKLPMPWAQLHVHLPVAAPSCDDLGGIGACRPCGVGTRENVRKATRRLCDRVLCILFLLEQWSQAPGSMPMSRVASDVKRYEGTSRLVGAGTFLNTRPARSNLEPWHGQ